MSKFDTRPKKDLSTQQGKNIFFDNKKETVEAFDPDLILRQTYYITELQRVAISLMSAHEDIDKSEIIRNALDAYIPKKYMQMALFK